MGFQILDIKPFVPSLPFTIQRWTGIAQGMANPYYVTNGVVLSTFSYSTGTFIPVEKLGNTPFEFSSNYKFYIEFNVLPNLQIKSAELKCGKVGTQDLTAVKDLHPPNWPSYPSLIHTEPQDVYNQDGSISILKNGKTQGMCYALIGYRNDDQEPNGQEYGQPNNASGPEGTGGFIPVQCFNSDIIMVNVAINGTPCVVPMPYFNASNHYNLVSAA